MDSGVARVAAGLAAIAIGGTGLTLAADQRINPYQDNGATLAISKDSALPDAGRIEIEVMKERPEVRLKKWDGEVSLGVRYDNVRASGSRAFLTDRIEWKGNNEEVHAYPLDATTGMEDGGFEIEVVLKEPPSANSWDFAIDGHQSLDFYWQPPLTAEDKASGAQQPENVDGSYAVYHKEKRDFVAGEKNYAAGKAFHIYRPKAIDANSDELWCALAYSEGALTVSCDEKWLSNAAYPVHIDPTFGFTSCGAGNFSIENVIYMYTASVPTGADVTSLQACVEVTSATKNMKMAVYDSAANLLGPSVQVAVTTAANGTAFTSFSMATSPLTLTADSYRIAVWSQSTTGNGLIRTDTSTGAYGFDSETYAANFPNPASLTGGSNRKLSVYATYDAPTAPPILPMSLWDDE